METGIINTIIHIVRQISHMKLRVKPDFDALPNERQSAVLPSRTQRCRYLVLVPPLTSAVPYEAVRRHM